MVVLVFKFQLQTGDVVRGLGIVGNLLPPTMAEEAWPVRIVRQESWAFENKYGVRIWKWIRSLDLHFKPETNGSEVSTKTCFTRYLWCFHAKDKHEVARRSQWHPVYIVRCQEAKTMLGVWKWSGLRFFFRYVQLLRGFQVFWNSCWGIGSGPLLLQVLGAEICGHPLCCSDQNHGVEQRRLVYRSGPLVFDGLEPKAVLFGLVVLMIVFYRFRSSTWMPICHDCIPVLPFCSILSRGNASLLRRAGSDFLDSLARRSQGS